MSDISLYILFCLALVAFVAGVTGYNLGKTHYIYKKQSKKAGAIVVNTTDPKKDVMTIELEMSIGELMTKDTVEFSIRKDDGVES